MNVTPRAALLRTINKVSFAINDATLYLDTHPYDTTAINFIQESIQVRNNALKKYSMSYGPLLIDDFSNNDTKWTWLNSPMPWEGGNC